MTSLHCNQTTTGFVRLRFDEYFLQVIIKIDENSSLERLVQFACRLICVTSVELAVLSCMVDLRGAILLCTLL
jgi:hypothetical protein